jgi:hypothetical protein
MQINPNNQPGFGCGYCIKIQQRLVDAGLPGNKADEYVRTAISDMDLPNRFHIPENEQADIADLSIYESCDHESKAAFLADLVKNSIKTIVDSCKL